MDVPQIIAGRFRIECEIGRGGMGTVYRATHLGLERPVAVKIIKTEYASDPHVTDRFLREARTMARLRHPHAAMIFDAGNLPDGRHFIIMEFVEGPTLSETLLREGRFTPERAVRIASDICDVLAEAHSLGIIHRDLKPSNIILNERGVCVLDFGVAKVLATTSSDKLMTHALTTGSGAIVGTPRYMSPEQCMGQRVGVRSDLYSLGVLLYEMLAGRPPFVDHLASAVLVKQATSQPTPLTVLRPEVPRPLALAVHTLLAKQPENRPRSAAVARSLLEKSIVQPERIAPEISPMATTVSTVGAGFGAGRCIIFRAITPVMIIAVLGVLLFVWGSSGKGMLQTASLETEETPTTASRDSLAASAGAPITLPVPLTLDEARRAVDAVAHGSVSDVRLVRRGREGIAIIAIHDEHRAGTTHLFMMERAGGGRFRITARAPLDAEGFRGATWTAETLDTGGDGSDEVLYTGTNARGRAAGYRLVLYVPHTRQNYWLRIEEDSPDAKVLRATWSPNALKRAATPYRTVLQQHARLLTGAR